MNREQKTNLIKKYSLKSPVFKDCFFSFIFGGAICAFGEVLFYLYSFLPLSDDTEASSLVTMTLIFISSLLTGVGIFDRIGRIAGAGTLVPVTGFANAVVSEAMDSKSEGAVFGIGAKIFTVAGPVILFGISSGIVYGFVLWLSYVFIALF